VEDEIMNLRTAFKEFAGKEIGVLAESWQQRGHRYWYGELDDTGPSVQRLREVFPKCLQTSNGDSHIELALGASEQGTESIRADIDRGEDGKWRFRPTVRFG
jgi:hypothetical protein